MSSLYTSAVSYVHGSGTRRLKAAVTPAPSQSVQSGCGAGSATQTVLETLQLIGGGEDGGGLLKLNSLIYGTRIYTPPRRTSNAPQV